MQLGLGCGMVLSDGEVEVSDDEATRRATKRHRGQNSAQHGSSTPKRKRQNSEAEEIGATTQNEADAEEQDAIAEEKGPDGLNVTADTR